jgi:hypothetical protein
MKAEASAHAPSESQALTKQACPSALCPRVFEEEVTLLRELGQKLQGPMFAKWMKGRRTLNLDQARKGKKSVPWRLRALIDEIVEQNRMELRAELEGFRGPAQAGSACPRRTAGSRAGTSGGSERTLISGGQRAHSGTR